MALRLATWNVEWMTALFDAEGRLIDDGGPSRRHGVTRGEQLAAIGVVLKAVDADAVVIIEAPDEGPRRSATRALTALAEAAGLRAHAAIIGFPSATEQEIAALYDPDRIALRHDPQGPDRFDGQARIDPGDGVPMRIRWARAPLELAAVTAGGAALRLIGVHAKSQAPRHLRDPARRARVARQNRRKQIAQCLWLRSRIEAHLDAGDPLVVLGDLNDGPGIAGAEAAPGRSAVEIVMGTDPGRQLYDPHAEAARRGAPPRATARFWIGPEGRYLPALLDYAMVSPPLMAARPRWRIWHPFDDPGCAAVPALQAALLAASDHFPVTLDLDL
jgi:hypothetical protein